MSSNDNLRPAYEDDQPSEEAYKRGNQHKWTKARKADYDEDSGKKEHVDKRAYVCLFQEEDRFRYYFY